MRGRSRRRRLSLGLGLGLSLGRETTTVRSIGIGQTVIKLAVRYHLIQKDALRGSHHGIQRRTVLACFRIVVVALKALSTVSVGVQVFGVPREPQHGTSFNDSGELDEILGQLDLGEPALEEAAIRRSHDAKAEKQNKRT